MKKGLFSLTLCVLLAACLPQATQTGTPPGMGTMGAAGDAKTVSSGDASKGDSSTGGGEENSIDSLPDAGGPSQPAAIPPATNDVYRVASVAGQIPMPSGTVAPSHDVHVRTFALLVGTRSNACTMDSGKTSVHINARLFWAHAGSAEELTTDDGVPSNGDGLKLRVSYKESESLDEWRDFPFQNRSPHVRGATARVDVSILTSDPSSVHYTVMEAVTAPEPSGNVPSTVDHLTDASPSPIPSCSEPKMEIEMNVNGMNLDQGVLRRSDIPRQ